MVELLATVIRNSLFPVRSAFKSTSSAAASMGGAMHHHHQLLFFSPNFFMPSPRRAKGKEKEGEEPRLRRVLQCREWSCGTTRNLLCCPAHGLPFMLQELLPYRERPVRRFQNPRAQFSNRHSKPIPVRSRGSLGAQRRHVSHTALNVRTHPPPRGQPKASTSKIARISTSTDSLCLEEALKLIYNFDEVALDDLILEDAWAAFDVILQNPRCINTPHDKSTILRFVERFCDKIELLYEEDDNFNLLKKERERLRTMVEWLDGQLKDPTPDEFMAVQILSCRCRAMYGQDEAAIEILERLRAMKRESIVHPLIAKAYKSIYSSIFYYRDGIHVVHFLDRHFFLEYFRPPYCLFYRDRGDTALAELHPRLLYILSTIRSPISLLRGSDAHSSDWPNVVILLILAYCHHNLPQAALSLFKEMPQPPDVRMTPPLQIRVVRALARGGHFDEAYRVFNEIPRNTPEYPNTGAHLFALQGDYSTVRDQFAKGSSKHHRAMRLLGLAVQGNTIRFRTLFDLEFPQLGPGTYKAQKPTVVDYAIAVHSHARGSDPEGIAYWMKRMSDDGIQPNLHVYSSIIQSYLRSGNLGAVADVLNEMREAGVAPNVVIYTDIITALSRHHKPSTAEGIFKRALQENIKPDQAMVGALLNCYVEAGQWDEAVTLFRSLEANTRSPLHLTIEMYNIALKGYVIMGAPFRVVATLFERLDADEDVAPTDITFALLLQSACESGYMRAAMDIFKEMDRRATEGAKGLINPYIFTILMSGLLRKGNRDEAMVVYREMLNRGLEPTSVTFNTVLRYYSNERSEESLRLTYEFMERVARREEEEQAPILAEGNLRLSPTQLVFEPVLRECATSGDVEGFERVLGDMLDAGGQIGMVTLTALLDLYRRKSRLESATKVWEHLLSLGDEAMQAARFLVDGKEDIESRTDMLCVSLTIYLGMLSEIGEHERVLQTWQTYQQKGFSFNFFNWNSLGSYLIRAGEYERAFEILDRIILPYIRIVRNQKDRSPPATVNAKEKPEEIWRTPFEVLNKTNLSFLQSTILPNRPLTSSSRVKVMRRRSFRDNEEIFTSLALKPTSRPGASSSPQPPPSSPPSTSSNDTVQSTPSSASSAEPEESEKPTDPSPSSPSIPLHPGSAATREPLDPSNIPNFVRPLWLMSQSNSSSAPRVHFSLFRHLLMGYQRLRAGQPPLASSQASGDNMYSTEYSPEQQEMSRAQLGKIVEKYPDAVAAVLDFEQQERVRLGDNYEKTYFWG